MPMAPVWHDLGYQYTNGWDSFESYVAKLDDGSYDASADRSAGLKTHEVATTVAYRFGNVVPRFSYAHGFKGKGDGLTDSERKITKYDQVVLGADYDFSKRTTALVSAGWLRAGGGDNKVETTAGKQVWSASQILISRLALKKSLLRGALFITATAVAAVGTINALCAA